MSCSCRRRPSSAPTRFMRSWYGSSKRRPLRDQRREQIPVGPRERLGREPVLLPPREIVNLRAVGELGAGGPAHGVPDFLARVRAFRIEREVAVRTLERHAGRALVDRGVVLGEQAGAPRELGRDLREIARIAARRDGRLAQREALMVPELLDVLRAADADQLQTLEIGRVGQQHVGEVIRLVARIGERDHERETRHLLARAPPCPRTRSPGWCDRRTRRRAT